MDPSENRTFDQYVLNAGGHPMSATPFVSRRHPKPFTEAASPPERRVHLNKWPRAIRGALKLSFSSARGCPYLGTSNSICICPVPSHNQYQNV